MGEYNEAMRILTERFGCDSLISLATVENGSPSVRIVNAYYEDGAFYAVTYELSNKMKQIAANPNVAVCGEWFTAHGVGENMGYVRAKSNAVMMGKLRQAFAVWYGNGHVDEIDPHTCLLRVRLTDGVFFHDGQKYDIDFEGEQHG